MIHEERMVDRCWQFDMTKVTGTGEICLSACHTAGRILERYSRKDTAYILTCLVYIRDPGQGHTNPRGWAYSGHQEGQDS